MKDQCQTCKYFYIAGIEDTTKQVIGECLRYPPVYVGRAPNNAMILSFATPMVTHDFGCGEHKYKE